MAAAGSKFRSRDKKFSGHQTNHKGSTHPAPFRGIWIHKRIQEGAQPPPQWPPVAAPFPKPHAHGGQGHFLFLFRGPPLNNRSDEKQGQRARVSLETSVFSMIFWGFYDFTGDLKVQNMLFTSSTYSLSSCSPDSGNKMTPWSTRLAPWGPQTLLGISVVDPFTHLKQKPSQCY